MDLKKIYFSIFIILLIAAAFFVNYHKASEKDNSKISSNAVNENSNSQIYSFLGDAMDYSKERGIPEYNISFASRKNGVDEYLINFKSRPFLNYPTRIFGLLFIPENKTNVPGMVFLPGGAMSKDQKAENSQMIAEEGYAVLVIDQRGINETGGYYLGPEQDYEVFLKGYEPIQHLSVYDALRTFDVLRQIKNVNSSDVGIMGESMGGRYAMIAAALDENIKGAIIISSSGFHVKENLSDSVTDYIVSIDPDHYIKKISPRPIMFLQGDNDSVVKLEDAKYTYNLAGEPKKFFIAKGCTHGYCDKMKDELFNDLKIILGK